MKLPKAKFIVDGRYQFIIQDVVETDFDIEVTYTSQTGIRKIEKYAKLNSDGSQSWQLEKFAQLARAATNNTELEEVEPTDLIGKKVDVVVDKKEYIKNGELKRYYPIKYFKPAGTLVATTEDGFTQIADNTEDIPF